MPKFAVYNRGIEEKEGNENQSETIEYKLKPTEIRFIIFLLLGVSLLLYTWFWTFSYFSNPLSVILGYAIAIFIWLLIMRFYVSSSN